MRLEHRSRIFFSLEKILEPLTHSFCWTAVFFFFPAVFFFSALTHSFWWTAVFFFSECIFFFPGFFFLWPYIILWMFDDSTPKFFSHWLPAPYRIKNSMNLSAKPWYEQKAWFRGYYSCGFFFFRVYFFFSGIFFFSPNSFMDVWRQCPQFFLKMTPPAPSPAQNQNFRSKFANFVLILGFIVIVKKLFITRGVAVFFF